MMGPTEYHDIAAQTITEAGSVSLLEPGGHNLSITFSNHQRFSNCSPTVDTGFVKLMSDNLRKQDLYDE
jgi:hypothetical protein